MKNQLASIYEQMLLNEAEKSDLQSPTNDEVGSIKAKQDLFGSKPKAVEGPDKAKVKQGPSYVQTTGKAVAGKSEGSSTSSAKSSAPAAVTTKDAEPEEAKEMKDTEVDPTKEKEEDEKEEKKEQKNEGITLSAFEALFKKTLTEELGEEEIYEEEPSTEEAETEHEAEETTEEELAEEGDLLSDLRDLQDRLADILAKLEDVSEENEVEAESEEYTDQDFEEEFGNEEEAVKEAIEKPKPLADAKGKSLQSKQNKVGSVKPKGGKAHTGKLKEEPEPKALGDKKGHLQKGNPEVSSSVKKGEFIK